MQERSIIIADRDVAYRGRMASFFRKAGYRVEATGSADLVLAGIQGKQAPVLLLGSDFGNIPASAELVRLLKRCNSQLQIIMVSDGMTISQARALREEGIFYQTLRPATPSEAEELEQAVACAFDRQQGSVVADHGTAAHDAHAGGAHLMNALSWAAGIGALIIGTNYFSFPASHTAHEGNSLAVWMFLGFCAMLVTSQLLPILRIKPVLAQFAQRQTAQGTPRADK
jgi:FixJ family two-component response regulator